MPSASPTTSNATNNAAAAANSNNNTSSNAKKTSSPANSKYVVNSNWSLIGSLIQFAFASFCLVYLTPFGRVAQPATSFVNQLYDLLFTENLKDYAPTQKGMTFFGPALIATFTRPFGLVFDDRFTNFLFEKLKQFAGAKLDASTLANIKLYVIETRMLNFVLARMIMAGMFVFSLAQLRHALAVKFKTHALPRIFTALTLATAIPLLSASALQTQTFSMICLNLALAALLADRPNRAFSLLAFNAAVFDAYTGTFLLVSTILVAQSVLKINAFKSLMAALLTFPFAAAASSVFDSLFYNKFIWPQGELFLAAFNPQALKATLQAFKAAALSLTVSQVESFFKSKLAINLAIALVPMVIVYFLGRSNRYARAFLALYTLNSSFSLVFMAGNLNSACTPQVVPLLAAASIAILSWIRSNNKLARYVTYFFTFGLIIPALAWSVGYLHLDIASSQQFTGKALMALNAKILKEAQEGVPVRVHIDSDAAGFGYNRFVELRRNAFYSSTAASKPPRLDYFVGKCSSSDAKALKMFQGFQKVDIKGGLKISLQDRIGVYKGSSNCVISADSPASALTFESAKEPSSTSKLLSNYVLKGQFTSLRDQRDFISNHLGRFNHKKLSNSAALIAYLYANLLEQI